MIIIYRIRNDAYGSTADVIAFSDHLVYVVSLLETKRTNNPRDLRRNNWLFKESRICNLIYTAQWTGAHESPSPTTYDDDNTRRVTLLSTGFCFRHWLRSDCTMNGRRTKQYVAGTLNTETFFDIFCESLQKNTWRSWIHVRAIRCGRTVESGLRDRRDRKHGSGTVHQKIKRFRNLNRSKIRVQSKNVLPIARPNRTVEYVTIVYLFGLDVAYQSHIADRIDYRSMNRLRKKRLKRSRNTGISTNVSRKQEETRTRSCVVWITF